MYELLQTGLLEGQFAFVIHSVQVLVAVLYILPLGQASQVKLDGLQTGFAEFVQSSFVSHSCLQAPS